MASLPTPKNPAVLLLAGAALWMLTRRRAQAQPAAYSRWHYMPAQQIRTGSSAIDYANPPAVAEQLAQFVNRMTRGTATKDNRLATDAAVEVARLAVRAGDTSYGLGANGWYVSNAEEARNAVRIGDGYYGQGWTQPLNVQVTTAPTALGNNDQTIFAPVYDPAVDADRWSALTDWTG